MPLVVVLEKEVKEGIFSATGTISSGEVTGEVTVLVEKASARKAKLIVDDSIQETTIAGKQVIAYNKSTGEAPIVTSTKDVKEGSELEFTQFSFTSKK